MNAAKMKLSSIDAGTSFKDEGTELEVTDLLQSDPRNDILFSFNDLASFIQDMPNVSETIVTLIAPVRSRCVEPLEEREPHGGFFCVWARVSQPYSSSGGTGEDLRVVPILETQVEVFRDCHHVSQPCCVSGDTHEDCYVKV